MRKQILQGSDFEGEGIDQGIEYQNALVVNLS
mgnify:CR=1 FL=1